MHIRPETSDDQESIRGLLQAAFESDAEARLVEALRQSGLELISLVAVEDGLVVGHILFSPVTLDSDESIKIAGLAPMAVLPQLQKQGIGARLILEGLKACELQSYEVVVVLGHPQYYPHFGFESSLKYGIHSEFEVPDDAFMLQELKPHVLEGKSGTIHYAPAFKQV
ncbi:MAG: N-acetyltransferase [Gammaproteobacteria bacterium]|nr:N-acetyltransferase [Gammaproteobacteria bacterium]